LGAAAFGAGEAGDSGDGEGAPPICAAAAAANREASTANEALFMRLLQKKGSKPL
jgi:hypothetical protein